MEFSQGDIVAGLFILAVLVYILIELRKDKEELLRRILLYLVTVAEREFGAGTGEIKYAAVVTWAYEKFPVALKFLFTEKQLDKMIEESVTKLKEELENNPQAREKIEKEEICHE